jgi:serine phosphatase RsbU (regulator of sigma subunit)
VSERLASLGGIVAVHSDLTELKENEERVVQAHRFMLESVRYASRIQSAMLPNRRALAQSMQDYFLIWEPRDIVGGDFFWFHRTDTGYFIIIGDCTGHGVPGAFMTLIACGLLDRHLRTDESSSPGMLLSMLHRDLQMMLGQGTESEGETDDGFEAGVCFVNCTERRLVFAGAHFSLYRASAGAIEEIKGDRAGIGYRRLAAERSFAEVTFDLTKGQSFYMTTDGLLEQVGGANYRCFGRKRFMEAVAGGLGLSMADQRESLVATLACHQGQQARRDDVTVLGFVP